MAFRARGKEIINSIASVSTGKLPLYKKLWENPAPTSAFTAQTITLLSDDYDFLLCVYRRYSTVDPESVAISEKGIDFEIEANYATNNGVRVHIRSASIQNSGLTISWGDALVATGTTASSTNNNGCIPVAIYGFKKEVDIQSVIASVSTEANKCIMSDGVTNVEDAISEINSLLGIIDIQNNVASVQYPCTAGYGCYIFLCFMQNYGSVMFSVRVQANTPIMKSLCDLNDADLVNIVSASYTTNTLTVNFLTGNANIVTLYKTI